MSIRTININLEEQYPRPRTLGFFPDQTPREDDLLLDGVYIAKTDATGAGSIDLPTTSLGTLHYRVEIDGEDAGSFYLSSGGPVDLSDLLFAGGAPTDSLIDYINNLLDDYAPLAGANFTGPIKAPSLQLLDPNYVPFLGGSPPFMMGHTATPIPVGSQCFDIVDIFYQPTANGQVQIGRFTQMKPSGITSGGALYANYTSIDNRSDNGLTNSLTAVYGAVNNEHTSKLGMAGLFSAFSGGSGADNTELLVGVQGVAGGAHNCTLQQAIGGDFGFSTSTSDPSTTSLAKVVHVWSSHQSGHNTSDLRGLSIDGWQTFGGTVNKSYGIYIDASIDMGSTEKWTIYSLATSPSVFAGPVRVPDEAVSKHWDGSFEAPTKNAVYDGFPTVSDLYAMGFPFLPKGGTQIVLRNSSLGAGDVVLYTVPTGKKFMWLYADFTNSTAGAISRGPYFDKGGLGVVYRLGTFGVTTPVNSNGSLFTQTHVFSAGDKIIVNTSGAGLGFFGRGLLWPDTEPTLKTARLNNIPASPTLLYQVPLGKRANFLLESMNTSNMMMSVFQGSFGRIVNDGATGNITIWVVPSGESVGSATLYAIFSLGSTLQNVFANLVPALEGGDAIWMSNSAGPGSGAAGAHAWLSMLEVSVPGFDL